MNKKKATREEWDAENRRLRYLVSHRERQIQRLKDDLEYATAERDAAQNALDAHARGKP